MRLKLLDAGWTESQIFLDLEDIKNGQNWRQILNVRMRDAVAVVACITDEWLESHECVREFTQAETLGKPVFIAIFAPISNPLPRFISDIQYTDLCDEATRPQSMQALVESLLAARIEPEGFPFPPPDQPRRSPYRGLAVMDAEDAGVFFGRDPEIKRALQLIRRMRETGAEQVMLIGGASGTGKSSFLRAGILPRLARDKQFMVFPVVRPGRNPLSGQNGIGTSLGQENATVLRLNDRLASLVANGDYQDNGRTLVIPVDQAEELLNPEIPEATEALKWLRTALATHSNVLVLMTVRTDAVDALNHQLTSDGAVAAAFTLPRMPTLGWKSVIEGPGARLNVPIRFESELLDILGSELAGPDTLPLLSLSLHQTIAKAQNPSWVTVHDFTDVVGGVAGAIQIAVDAALASASSDERIGAVGVDLLGICKDLFIPALVLIRPKSSSPEAAVATLNQLSPKSQFLVEHFVANRLLVLDGQGDKATIQVAHEVIFRAWPILNKWISDEKSEIEEVTQIAEYATAWSNDKSRIYLLMLDRPMLELAKKQIKLRERNLKGNLIRREKTDDYFNACVSLYKFNRGSYFHWPGLFAGPIAIFTIHVIIVQIFGLIEPIFSKSLSQGIGTAYTMFGLLTFGCSPFLAGAIFGWRNDLQLVDIQTKNGIDSGKLSILVSIHKFICVGFVISILFTTLFSAIFFLEKSAVKEIFDRISAHIDVGNALLYGLTLCFFANLTTSFFAWINSVFLRVQLSRNNRRSGLKETRALVLRGVLIAKSSLLFFLYFVFALIGTSVIFGFVKAGVGELLDSGAIKIN